MTLSPKGANIMSMFFMVLIMTCVVAFSTTLINFGMNTAFLLKWLRGWVLSFIIAFPTVLVIMPFIRKAVGKFTGNNI